MKTYAIKYGVPLALAFAAIYVANNVPQVAKVVGKQSA